MFRFSKKPSTAGSVIPAIRMTVMPEDFFGGKDPVVHFQPASPAVKRGIEHQKSAAPAGAPGQRAARWEGSFFSRHKIIAIAVAAASCVFVVAAISWYYIEDARRSAAARLAMERPSPPTPPEASRQPPVPLAKEAPAATSTTDTAQTEPEPAESAPPVFGDTPIQFPRLIFVDTTDLDGDSLTDMEEDVFATDSGVYDTDGDGYYDGQEVLNLYNPRGVAPVKLFDSGLVREYQSPAWKYRVYYPAGWESAPVDAEGLQVLLSSVTGDYIEIRTSKKNPGESFSSWFGRMASREQFSDLSPIQNRFQVPLFERSDRLVSYADTDEAVFVIVYQPRSPAAVPFRRIMSMVTQSFRPARHDAEMPAQIPMPQESEGATAAPPGEPL